MKIKNRIITRYCYVSIKTLQRVIINNLLEFTYFSAKKVMRDMSKKGPGGIHLTPYISIRVDGAGAEAVADKAEVEAAGRTSSMHTYF